MPLARIRQYPMVEPFETLKDAEEALRKLTGILQEEATKRTEDFRTEHISTLMKARAYLSADQLNISSGVATKVLLDTESYDLGDNFASYKFVAPITGYYQVNAGVRYVSASVVADERYFCIIRRNGVNAVSGVGHAAVADAVLPTCSDVLYLAAEQYLELFAYHVAGVDTVDIDGGTAHTYMSVHLLSA